MNDASVIHILYKLNIINVYNIYNIYIKKNWYWIFVWQTYLGGCKIGKYLVNAMHIIDEIIIDKVENDQSRPPNNMPPEL